MSLVSAIAHSGDVTLEIDTVNGHRLAVHRSDGQADVYDVVVDMCQSPVCSCWDINLICTPPQEAAPSKARRRILSLDLSSRGLSENRSRMAPADLALARGLAAGMSPDQWQKLCSLFVAAKRRIMDNCDLASLDVLFPPEVELEGSMVAYSDVFLYARELLFEAEGERWLVEDLHCLQRRCTCYDVLILFYAVGSAPERSDTGERPGAPPTLQPTAAVRFDLRRLTMELEPDPPADASAAFGLMAALRESHPDVLDHLAERRRVLRSLFRRYLRRVREEKRPPAPASPKVGRNDPCPCGSGKKFKRCCGR